MNTVTYSPDKFGYYTVGNYKTYSKLEAIELQNKTNQFPEWNFNRDTFDKLDWTKEPAIELWELYKLRAKQIRNSYDYVVLFYSGGCDSFNIVDSWIAADCKIDEIVSFWNYDGTKEKDDLANVEVNQVVLKEIPKFQARTEFKFRLVDTSEAGLNYLKRNDILYDFNSSPMPHRNCIPAFRETIKDYADLIAAGKKICFVWGVDKPQIFYDGRHYVQFFDIFGDVITNDSQQKYHSGWYDELFYWSPDLPEMMIKQAQIVKRFLENCHDVGFYQDESAPFGYNPTVKKYLKKTSFMMLLYPTFNPFTFTIGKTPDKFFVYKDRWLWNSNIEEKNLLTNTVKYMIKTFGNYWLNNPNDLSQGIKKHASPKYYL